MTGSMEALLHQTTESRPRPQHVHVVVERNSGKVVRGDGLFGRVLPSLRGTLTYALLIDTWVDIYDVDQVMRIFVTKEDAKIRFRLRVIARASRAEQIVETLCETVRNPQQVLFVVITDTIRSLSDESQREGPDSLARRIARDRDNWQRRIQQSILDRIGLESEIIFELGAELPEYPEIAVRHFDVRAKDAPHRIITVSLHAVLEPTEERAHDPLPRSDREREERLRLAAVTAFRDEVLLYDCWFDRRKVESILSRAVDRAFRTTAHRSRVVQMEPVAPPTLREEKVACTVAWKGNAGRQIDFYVEAVLALTPAGTGLYDSLHLEPRAKWLAEQSRRALEIAMHGRDFWDLALADQSEVAARVESILRTAATDTGQTVDPVVAGVVLPENRWLDKQFLELAGERFKTKNDLGYAEFDVLLDIQFRTIRPLVDFIRHHRQAGDEADDFNVAIEASILDLVRKTVRSLMSQIEHSDYFAHWERWDHTDEVQPGTARGQANYVHNRLVLAIQKELRSRFDPAMCNVHLRRVDRAVGEILRVIMALQAMEVSLEIMPEGLISRAQMIPAKVRFRPGYLEPSRVPEVVAYGPERLERSAIMRTLESGALQFLSGLPAGEIRGLAKGLAAPVYAADVDRRALQIQLEEHVSRLMIATYGFSISVEDVRIGFTEAQKVVLDTESMKTIAQQTLVEAWRTEVGDEFENLKTQRAQNLALVDKLYAALRNNPLLTQDDRHRYHQDEELLERTKRRIAEDEELNKGRLGKSVDAAKRMDGTLAPPERGTTAGEAPVTDDGVIDVPQAAPDRPSRL